MRKFEWQEAQRIRQKYLGELQKLPGITGIGLERNAEGSCYINLGFVSQKDIDKLTQQGRIPASLDGVPVKFRVTDPVVPLKTQVGIIQCWEGSLEHQSR